MVNSFPPIAGTTIIALGHRARHGKDTAAGAILTRCSKARRYAFADALKAYCRVRHGMTTKDNWLLQNVGMEMRAADPDIWVKTLYFQIAEERPRYAIVTDMRMLNELDMVRQAGGVTIRVQRYTADGALYQAADRDPRHVSEVQLQDATFDFDLRNDRGVGDLVTAATEVFFQIDQSVQAAK